MNKQDYENIKALIMRCTLKGEEAVGVANLLIKIEQEIKKLSEQPEEKQ